MQAKSSSSWLLTLTLVCFSFLPARAAKNVILFIGDGMGYEHVKASSFYKGEPLSFESLARQGAVTTRSANAAVTDSAAAGTAMATGVKVNNDVVSVALPGDGKDLETMLELFKKRGKATGLITTAYLTHATPAAFGAHDPSRNNTTAIGLDLMNQTRPDVLFGGGGNGLTPAAATSAGYTVATDAAGFASLSPAAGKLCALFGTGYLPYEEDYLSATYPYPHLRDMVTKALDALDGDPDGFFLMVEAGRIDHAAHSNLLPEAVHETLELSRAVKVALDWMDAHPDTLLIVTADHETGGLTVTADNGVGKYPTVKWSTTGHTAANVPVYAAGPGAELVSGTMDNTQFLRLVTIEGTAAPFLHRVSVQDLSDTTATIVWNTDEPCDSVVQIRAVGATGWVTLTDSGQVLAHRVALNNLVPGTTYEYQVSSANSLGTRTTSGTYTFTPVSDPSIALLLIAPGATWKYHDGGADLGTAWRAPAYDDSQWKQGLAELGYGDGDEKTILSYGPNASAKYITYYFRKTLTVTNPAAYGQLLLSLLYDDGAVVYLNGTEVYRVNMPSGTVAYNTYASSATEYGWANDMALENLLVPGENVIAVEVHQGNATSSDLSFDLELAGTDPNNVRIVKGPWLQNVTPTSIVVRWETDIASASRVDFGVSGADEQQAADTAAVRLHEVTLTGLLPNTFYRYAVASGNAVSSEATFQTAPATQDESFRFAIYGDTQVPANHPAVVSSILANNPLPRFVLHAGDQTDYGRTYSYWDGFFTPAAPLLQQIPLFTALGNHEYSGSEQMWYFDFFSLPDNGTGLGQEEWYAFTYGSVRVIALNSSAAFSADSAQHNWLKAELQSPVCQGARWRVVFFHHPPFPEQVPGLEANLVPLFHQYGVHLVFSGHNHSYRHIYRQDPTWGTRVDYFITGGGGSTLGAPLAMPSGDSTLKFVTSASVYHHCVLDVSPGSLTLKAIDTSGKVLDTMVLYDTTDTTPPVISAVAASTVTDTTAQVTWTTDENANATVQYRPTGSTTLLTASDPTYVTAHSVLLTNLQPSTDYEFVVTSADPAGNLSQPVSGSFTTRTPNAAPFAYGQMATLDEDTLTYLTLTATDADNDPLTYRIVTSPANGTLAGDPPNVSYTPKQNFNGTDSFQFVANDGRINSAAATVTLNVSAVNDAPIADADNATTVQGVPVVIPVLANDTDPEGAVLAVTGTTPVAYGTVVINADKTITYRPDRTYVGDVAFTYTVSDGELTATATVTVTVRPFVLFSDGFESGNFTAGGWAVSANATVDPGARYAGNYGALFKKAASITRTLTGIPSGNITLSYSRKAVSLESGEFGSFEIFQDGQQNWATIESFTGTTDWETRKWTLPIVGPTLHLRFSLNASDAKDQFMVDDVLVEGEVPNSAPDATGDAYSTDEDTTLAIAPPGLLSNDSDADGDPLAAVLHTAPTRGTLALTGTGGGFTYVPGRDFSGTDTFSYVATDGLADSAPVSVTIAVKPVNDAPVAHNQSVTVAGNSSIAITLTASDVDGDTLSYSVAADPQNGSLSGTVPNLIYEPNAGFSGTDSFTFTVSDGRLTSSSATVNISVTSVNRAPVAEADSGTTAEDTHVTLAVLANDTDPDRDTLTVSAVTQASNGTVSINSGSTLTYTPAANYFGSDAFTYTVTDGRGGSATASVTVNVTAVNDAPVAIADAYTTEQDAPSSVAAPGLLANDSDPDGNSLQAALAAGPANGTLTLNADGSFSYTPNIGFSGEDSFTYTVSDGNGGSATGTVTITVKPTVTAPKVHVDSIALVTATASKNVKAAATVKIVDGNGAATAGATVYGEWTYNSASLGSASAATDASGSAVLSSAAFKAAKGSTLIFTVTSVVLTGAEYDPAANVVDTASIGF